MTKEMDKEEKVFDVSINVGWWKIIKQENKNENKDGISGYRKLKGEKYKTKGFMKQKNWKQKRKHNIKIKIKIKEKTNSKSKISLSNIRRNWE